MKRIFALVLCVLIMVSVFAIVASAEDVLPKESTITESIVGYVKDHFEEISVVVTLVMGIFYSWLKNKSLSNTIGTLNNNAITVAENSDASIKSALAEVAQVSATVGAYADKVEAFLAEARENVKEKEKLAEMLAKAEAFIETAKLANKELADEIVSLLTLANIPNSVKDELYARHSAAVKAIAEAEHTAEVIHNDGVEA